MKYYFDILDSGTLVIDLVETLIDRHYGNEKEYIKYKITTSYWMDNNYLEDRFTTSGTWNWKTVNYHYFGKKDI